MLLEIAKRGIKPAISTAAPYVTVVGSVYGFGKTCIQVYNSTTPTGKIVAGVKGLIIDCTPPVVKYPLLCAATAACAVDAIFTSDPGYVVSAVECCTAIVKQES